MKEEKHFLEGWQTRSGTHMFKTAGQARHARNPTTSFLTATTLIYATGAGITAAAGTRLALQLLSLRGLNCSHSNYQTL